MNQVWYILRVSSGREVAVARRLGAPAYVPHRSHVSFNRRLRRVNRRLLPAMPGFVFVRAPLPAHTLFPGVLGWARDRSGSRLALSAQDIADMRRLEVGLWRVGSSSLFAVGDRVTFQDRSLLAGLEAVVRRLKENTVLVELLSGLKIEAPVDGVRLAA